MSCMVGHTWVLDLWFSVAEASSCSSIQPLPLEHQYAASVAIKSKKKKKKKKGREQDYTVPTPHHGNKLLGLRASILFTWTWTPQLTAEFTIHIKNQWLKKTNKYWLGQREHLCGPQAHSVGLWFLVLYLFVFFRAISVAYESSQAGGWIGAAAAGLTMATPTPDLSHICKLYHSL